jgi:hypothetical protein
MFVMRAECSLCPDSDRIGASWRNVANTTVAAAPTANKVTIAPVGAITVSPFRGPLASFRPNEFRKKLPGGVADLFVDEVVQQRVHPQDRFTVFHRLKREIAHFLGVALQAEKLHVVVPKDFLQRSRRVERGRRVPNL